MACELLQVVLGWVDALERRPLMTLKLQLVLSSLDLKVFAQLGCCLGDDHLAEVDLRCGG
jgi:hypothetical protein